MLLQLDSAVPASMYADAEEVRLLLAMLEKAVPVVIGPLLDAEVLPPLDGAAPASVYIKVVRASNDFFDKAQLLLKKSPLLDGYVLPELAAPEVDVRVDMPVVIELALDAEVLLQLDGAVPASMYAEEVRLRLLAAMLKKAVPVVIGPLLGDAEVLPPLDGAAPASGVRQGGVRLQRLLRQGAAVAQEVAAARRLCAST